MGFKDVSNKVDFVALERETVSYTHLDVYKRQTLPQCQQVLSFDWSID